MASLRTRGTVQLKLQMHAPRIIRTPTRSFASSVSQLSSSSNYYSSRSSVNAFRSLYSRSYSTESTSTTKSTSTPPKKFVKTFDNQSSLPRLPIPPLSQTVNKYLKTLEPLLPADRLQQVQDHAQEFLKPGGVGEALQNKLIEYEKTQPNSWLEDIWLNKAYLEWREPSLINVNWWSRFIDHPDQPKDISKKPPPKGVLNAFQIQRAAGLINNFLNSKEIVESGNLPPEYMKTTPLCMNQYTNQFGATRIPGNPRDTISTPFPTSAKHIILMIKNQMYKVDVIHPNGSRADLESIERQLYDCAREANEGVAEPPVGILTATHRDNWANAFEELMKSPTNVASFEAVKDALFVVCLDDYSAKHNADDAHQQFFHNGDGSNRWFDKAIQLIVTNNGRAGVNGEHSPADAVIPARLFEYAIQNEPAQSPSNATSTPLPVPQKIRWDTNSTIDDYITKAQTSTKSFINNINSIVLHTDIYGSRYIKEIAQTSPDAYIQMVLQLAYYRFHNATTPVYESASTRLFKHGRTETCRSLSNESLEFVKSFDNDNILYTDKLALFRKAIQSHTEYIKSCAFGNGIDRHLLGLRAMMSMFPELLESNNNTPPAIFTDPSFIESMYFKLSTSNVSPGKYHYGGFGPVVPEGYGVNYAIDTDALKFSISWWNGHDTNGRGFRKEIERALKDMFLLFPKRTEVWGYDWREKRVREIKESIAMERMSKLSKEHEETLRKVYAQRGAVFLDESGKKGKK